jgi:hypothetical protein
MMSTCANMCVMTKRVTVILSDEEYAQLRNEAGLVPLSAYIRARIRPVDAALLRLIEKNDPQCQHHKKPGELCYKCDPKMGYPALP